MQVHLSRSHQWLIFRNKSPKLSPSFGGRKATVSSCDVLLNASATLSSAHFAAWPPGAFTKRGKSACDLVALQNRLEKAPFAYCPGAPPPSQKIWAAYSNWGQHIGSRLISFGQMKSATRLDSALGLMQLLLWPSGTFACKHISRKSDDIRWQYGTSWNVVNKPLDTKSYKLWEQNENKSTHKSVHLQNWEYHFGPSPWTSRCWRRWLWSAASLLKQKKESNNSKGKCSCFKTKTL